MSTESDAQAVREGGDLLPRYLFLEPWFDGRPVLEVGALGLFGTAGARLCLSRAARRVVCLGSAQEVAAAGEDGDAAIELLPLDAALPPETFGLVLLHDSRPLLAPGGVDRFARALAPGGRLLAVAAGGPPASLAGHPDDRPDYAALAPLLSARFPAVQVVVQSPLAGYTLSPHGVENPETVVDASLAGAPEPSHYLFLCGDAPAPLRELSLVALPAAPLFAGRARESQELLRAAEQLRGALAAAEAERGEWRSRAESLQREVEQREALLAWREQEARAAVEDAGHARREAEAYREDRDHARRQLAARSEELAAALARAAAAEEDWRRLDAEHERLGGAEEVRRELEQVRAQLARAEEERDANAAAERTWRGRFEEETEARRRAAEEADRAATAEEAARERAERVEAEARAIEERDALAAGQAERAIAAATAEREAEETAREELRDEVARLRAASRVSAEENARLAAELAQARHLVELARRSPGALGLAEVDWGVQAEAGEVQAEVERLRALVEELRRDLATARAAAGPLAASGSRP